MAEDLELWNFVEGYERIYRVIISRYKCIANKTRSITSGMALGDGFGAALVL